MSKNFFRIFCAIILPLSLSGCFAFPVGTRVETSKELSRKQVIESQKLKSIKIGEQKSDNLISLNVTGVYEEISFAKVDYDEKGFKKKVVIGFIPGYGVYKLGEGSFGGTSECHGSEFSWIGEIAVANIVIGITTAGHFLSEPFLHYDNWDSNYNPEYGPRFTKSCFSLFGWAKTHEHISHTVSKNENYSTGLKELPMSASVVLYLDNQLHSFQLTSDNSGACKYDPSSWAVISDRDLTATATASKDGITSEACRLTIAGKEVGKNLREKLFAGGVLPAKVWLNGREVNLTVKEKGLKTFAKTSSELVYDNLNNSTRIKFQVFNLGDAPLLRLVCRVETEGGAVDRIFIFERVEPGHSVSETLEIPVSLISSLKSPELRIRFAEANGNQPQELKLKIDQLK